MMKQADPPIQRTAVRAAVDRHRVREDQGDEDVMFIGVDSSRIAAESAMVRVLVQPGFADCPNGFHIEENGIDKDHWVEGFVSA